MFCCKPKKDKYDFDDGEGENEKKDKKSRESQKDKNVEKVANNDNIEAKGTVEDNNKTAETDSVVHVNSKDKVEHDDNEDIVFSEKRNGVCELAEENVTKTKAVTVEANINSGNSSEHFENQSEFETVTEKCQTGNDSEKFENQTNIETNKEECQSGVDSGKTEISNENDHVIDKCTGNETVSEFKFTEDTQY